MIGGLPVTVTKWSPKDPGDTRDYVVDFAEFVGDDVIADAVVTVPEDSVELVDQSFDDTTVTVRVAGGVVGSYDLGVTITTMSGQIFNLTATLKVAERVLK